MKKYKQDLLFDLFPELYSDIGKALELMENIELIETINTAAEELPKKQRIVFCMLIECQNSRDKAYGIFTKQIGQVTMEGFQKTMSRARKRVSELLTDSQIVKNLKKEIFLN